MPLLSAYVWAENMKAGAMNHLDYPSLFVSHGAPDLVLQETKAHHFLKQWGRSAKPPKAILVISAHYETNEPTLSLGDTPEMIYDFGGFDPLLRTLQYPAPGDDALAHRAGDLLAQSGFSVGYEVRGFDHGTWVPLMLLYPEAGIPIVQLSVQPDKGPAHHLQLGRALQSIRKEGVLIIGSGSFTHNLSAAMQMMGSGGRNAEAPVWVTEFADWMDDRLTQGAIDDLLNYRDLAPYATKNHPTDEHLLPLYVALGAAGDELSGKRLHRSHEFGALMMDAYAFGARHGGSVLTNSA